MKSALVTLLAIFLILPFTPWWLIWIILGVYGWSCNNYKNAIGFGGVIAAIVWGIKLGIGYLTGGSILMHRVAEMMNLGSSFGLITVSLIIAFILGIFSSLSGFQLKRL